MADVAHVAGEVRLIDLIWTTGITFITGVPDSEFRELIADLEAGDLDRNYVLATREDNAVAVAVGAYLAGDRPLVFMESSGLGNAIDALTSLAIVCRIPLVLLIAWAGYEGRDMPHHNSIGEPLRPLLDALKIPAFEVPLKDHAALASTVEAALARAQAELLPVAVLGIPENLRKER